MFTVLYRRSPLLHMEAQQYCYSRDHCQSFCSRSTYKLLHYLRTFALFEIRVAQYKSVLYEQLHALGHMEPGLEELELGALPVNVLRGALAGPGRSREEDAAQPRALLREAHDVLRLTGDVREHDNLEPRVDHHIPHRPLVRHQLSNYGRQLPPYKLQHPQRLALAKRHQVSQPQESAVDAQAREVAPGNDHEVQRLAGNGFLAQGGEAPDAAEARGEVPQSLGLEVVEAPLAPVRQELHRVHVLTVQAAARSKKRTGQGSRHRD